MSEWCSRWHVAVWAYCLMPNHVHMIMVPKSEEGVRRATGEAHRRYTRRVNFREGWRGHLWQGRFASVPLDQRYLLAAAHLAGRDDALVKVEPLLAMVGNWKDFLLSGVTKEEIEGLRRHERTERPLGNDGFVGQLEELLGRILQRRRPGRKKGQKQK